MIVMIPFTSFSQTEAILTSVSLRVDPEEGAEPGDHGDSAVVSTALIFPL